MVNRIVLVGRLTRDPELKTTTTGKNVVNFTIAVDKRFKPKDDGQSADFFRVTAWGTTADFVSNYLTKGRLCAVDGRLEQRTYNDKDGNKREIVEVVAESVQGLDRPKDGEGDPRPATPSADEYDPFAGEA